jgi:hypothetical protein
VAGRQVKDINQRRIFVHGVVEVSDLAGAVRVRGADELPEPVVGVVTDQQDRFATLEDFDGLDARGAQKPVPHPPRPSITLHDAVCDPPYEWEILVGASLVRREVRAALCYMLERLVSERARVAVLVLEHDSVKRAAAWIAGADPNRELGDVRLRPGGPAERVRGQFALRADELAECTAIHAHGLGSRHLDERTLQNLDFHAANLTDTDHVQDAGATCGTAGAAALQLRRPRRAHRADTGARVQLRVFRTAHAPVGCAARSAQVPEEPELL